MATDLFSRPAANGPVRPWDYVRMCREAAGLTIAQAAKPHWHNPEHRADVERITAEIERPGVILRKDYLVDGIRRSLPAFDPDLYRTLRDEPADRHPSICRGCGCTPWNPSVTFAGLESSIGPDLICSACEERAERDARRPARRMAA